MNRLRTLLLTFSASACSVLAQTPSPTVIPFQGRLTNQQNVPYAEGKYTLTFNLYNEAVGGTTVWTERHEQVGVINGTVNVFLGSIQTITSVDFSTIKHLGITIDADANPLTADPEMVPRQMIIPAFWAKQAENASKLVGQDWSSIIVNGTGLSSNDPSAGFVSGAKIQAASITAAQIQNAAVTSSKISDGTIVTADLSPELQLASIVPPGSIIPFAGANIPAGWRLCDGSALKGADYPNLYAAIGTAWGNGTTSPTGALGQFQTGTDFNLPDLRGMFLRGVNHTRNDQFKDVDARLAPAPGGNLGGQVGSLQLSKVGDHVHGGGTGTINGSLAARVLITDFGDLYVDHRTGIAAWNSDRKGIAGVSTPGNSSGGTLGATIVGQTATNAANTSESRPNNAYVNYIIKL